MVDIDKAFEVRYKKHNKEVQLLVDFDALQQYRRNPDENLIEDVLADHKIYRDQKKGEVAQDKELEIIFNTTDQEVIKKEILIHGECQIPTAYVNAMREEKRKQIINYIVENAHNPQTKTRYTYSMIENMFGELKMNTDPFRDTVSQAEQAVKEMKKKSPISMSKVIMILSVPPQYCGKFYGPFRNYGSVQKEFYDDKGNLHLHMEISESMIDEVANYIKNNSNGEGEYHVKQE